MMLSKSFKAANDVCYMQKMYVCKCVFIYTYIAEVLNTSFVYGLKENDH